MTFRDLALKLNLRYDETVHARGDDGGPLCGDAITTIEFPDLTNADVTCWECASIIG